MDDAIIEGRILKWGNSYGIRISKADLERAGLHPGQDARVRIMGKSARIDVSDAPFFSSGHTNTSERHDEVLAEARWRDLQEKRE